MSQFPHIHLPLQHAQAFDANPVSVVPLPDGEILLNFAGQPIITKLDAHLGLIWEKTMQGLLSNFKRSLLSASYDGKLFAIAGMTDIQILDAADARVLHRVEHPSWERFPGATCYFSRDMIWYILPDEGLRVMNALTFEVIASCRLVEAESYIFHATPDKNSILLEAIAGQEDTILMKVELKEGIIVIARLPQCVGIMGNFAPSGKEFVMAPYYDGPVKIYSFPDIAMITEVDQAAIFEGSKDYPAIEPDNINYTVYFIADNTILLLSQFGRLLLLDRKDLRCKAEVMAEGIVFTAHDLAGDPTNKRDQIYDYSSNIINVMIVHNQLLLTTASGELRNYKLPV